MKLSIISSSLLRIDSFRDSMRLLLSLTPEQLTRLRDVTEAEKEVSVTDALVARAQDALQVAEKEAVEIIYGFSFLYARAPTEEETQALLADLKKVATDLGIQMVTAKEDALGRLFVRIPDYDRGIVRKRALEGVMPVLEDWVLYCELRVIAEDQGTEIEGYVPVVVARFEFDEPIAGQGAIVFQITEETLKRLDADVKRIGAVLERVRLDQGDNLY